MWALMTTDGAPTDMGCATAGHAHRSVARRWMRNRVTFAKEELTGSMRPMMATSAAGAVR